ncbi:MAG TPA: rod shape-determining protein MreC [Pseudomonadales bacterium]
MSTVLIALESTTRLLEPARAVLLSVVAPLQVIAELPYLLSDEVGSVVATREGLRERNAELERRVLELSQVSQQYMALKAENERLRALLGSRARLPAEVLIAEIISVLPAPATHQVVLDKGTNDDVQLGDAVIDAHGLFGQVVEVGRYTSRVLLITDPNHAVPVQVNRNGVRSIAGGTGALDALQLENVSVTADIRQGDLIETSGLGGRFPPGYPVGYVDAVVIEPTAAFATVTVRPLAQLDRSRHVLVVLASESLDLRGRDMDLFGEEADAVDDWEGGEPAGAPGDDEPLEPEP